ncbi:MAG: hypothetical protein KC619_30510 [Myxococcales bacterium]|nr:hypothetical protein [Myxococcales bacterium]
MTDQPTLADSLDTSSALEVDASPTLAPALFRHSRRERWGLGAVTQHLHDRIEIQFQDGRARVFKQGYYHLLDAVDRPLDVTLGIVRALRGMNGETPARATRGRVPPSVDEQVGLFRELFEDGFQSEAYAAQHRGDGRKRPLKRHRDALVATAKEKLDKKAMQRALHAGDYDALLEAAGEVLAHTDLVAVKDRKAFLAMDPAHREATMSALVALLHGKSPLTVRFDAFVAALSRALGETPSWELVTIFLGALRPDEHVVIRPNVMTLQAAWMAPGLKMSKRPMGLLYERFLAMTRRVDEALRAAELSPRDLLDVADFSWATLRPAARERIFERRLELGTGPSIEPAAQREQEAA